jgi:replication factor C large subunit
LAAAKELNIKWTEKYRPQTLKQVRGNDKAISTLRKWAEAWEQGLSVKKGLILAGHSGTGKTSAAYALANDFNWGIIELNASDARNAENIRSIALAGSVNETFTATGEFVSAKTGGRKLIILDEVDNLFERMSRRKPRDPSEKDMSDAGGRAAIIETLKKSHQPVILIVNDLYELTRDSGAIIKTLSDVVKFNKIRQPTVRQLLGKICENEGIKITPDALDELSRRADGDMRSAINDLQLVAEGIEQVTFDQLSVLGYRNVRATIFDAVREIFKSMELERAQKAIWGLDEAPEDIIHWLDENLPLEYRRPIDLVNGYKYIGRADQFLGRTRRRQHYGFWAYANELMTGGVALAKQERYHGWVKYQFPSWILKMSRTKQVRQLQKSIAQKLGRYCHTSIKTAKQDIIPYYRYIFKHDHPFAVAQSIIQDYSKEEIGWLLEEKSNSNKVKYLMSEIKKTMERQEVPKAEKAVEIFPVHEQEEAVEEDKEEEPQTGSNSDESTEGEPEPENEETEENKNDEKKVQKNLFDY